MSRAGVMLEDKAGGKGAKLFEERFSDTALQSVQKSGENFHTGGIVAAGGFRSAENGPSESG